MEFQRFVKQAGFKVLALARLNEVEYSLILYLINSAVSGLDQLITTDSELASLIGYDESKVKDALETLSNRNMIRLHYGEAHSRSSQSLRIAMQFMVTRWQLDFAQEVNSKDAVVFPFRRKEAPALALLEGKPSPSKQADKGEESTWRRIIQSFAQGRSLDDDELALAEESARVLIETHPVDQILLMLRHFGPKIPTLSLLASSWSHYQELYEQETQRVDMLEARQKHRELDEKLRDQAEAMLAASSELGLSLDETTVLQIIAKHRHPRRQLFWAYQLRSGYPNLSGFFHDNAHLMLPVTSNGQIIKRHGQD
jgi:hypothetical protein